MNKMKTLGTNKVTVTILHGTSSVKNKSYGDDKETNAVGWMYADVVQTVGAALTPPDDGDYEFHG